MKGNRDRGPQGAWLRAARKARYSNVRDAVDALAEQTGHHIHYSAWAAYESGGRAIGDQHMEWLEGFFGPMPEPEPQAGGDVAAAIDRQTRAIERLTEMVAALMERQQDAATAALALSLGVPPSEAALVVGEPLATALRSAHGTPDTAAATASSREGPPIGGRRETLV